MDMDKPNYDKGSIYWVGPRLKGPCRIFTTGEVYFSTGRHRPSVITKFGHIEFLTQSLLLHRSDGPAVIYIDGTKDYWLNGKMIDEMAYFLHTGHCNG